MGGKIHIGDVPQDDADAVGQRQRMGVFQLRQLQPAQHGRHPLAVKGFAQIIAGVDLVALAGEFVAGGAEDQLYGFVRGPHGVGYLHAGDARHEDIQDHKVEKPGPPGGQKRFAACIAGQGTGRPQQAVQTGLQMVAGLDIVINERDFQSKPPDVPWVNATCNFSKLYHDLTEKAKAPEGVKRPFVPDFDRLCKMHCIRRQLCAMIRPLIVGIDGRRHAMRRCRRQKQRKQAKGRLTNMNGRNIIQQASIIAPYFPFQNLTIHI